MSNTIVFSGRKMTEYIHNNVISEVMRKKHLTVEFVNTEFIEYASENTQDFVAFVREFDPTTKIY